MLALPAETSLLGEGLLHDGSGVDKDFAAGSEAAGDEGREVLKHSFNNIVVVPVARVDGDVADGGAGEVGEGIMAGIVGQAEADNAAGAGPQGLRVCAFGGAVFEPGHFAMTPGGQEVGEALAGFWRKVRGGEANRVEAEGKGLVADGGLCAGAG